MTWQTERSCLLSKEEHAESMLRSAAEHPKGMALNGMVHWRKQAGENYVCLWGKVGRVS
jgi:hypothetical protein